MKKVSDYVSNEPAFPYAEQVKVDELVGEVLTFMGYASRTGETGEFYVLLVKHKDKELSFSNGGVVVMKVMKEIGEKQGVKENEDKVVLFNEGVKGKLTQKKSKDGRLYYNIED